MPVSPFSTDEKKKEYNELLSLYSDLRGRIQDLQQESVYLKHELQTMKDKQHMRDILQNIISQPD